LVYGVENIPEARENVKQKKVLVVDDQRPVLDTLGAMLTAAGYRAVCVSSGQVALSTARLTAFDAALIDIYMPEMDGFETAQRLREQVERRGRTIRIWHITGMNSPAVEKRSAASGVMGLLLKPFSLVHLCKVVEEGLAAPVPPLPAPLGPTRSPFAKAESDSRVVGDD
jgi:CheY-like chemotaxis protein